MIFKGRTEISSSIYNLIYAGLCLHFPPPLIPLPCWWLIRTLNQVDSRDLNLVTSKTSHCFHCYHMLFHPPGCELTALWLLISCCFVCLSQKQFCSLTCISMVNNITFISQQLPSFHMAFILCPAPCSAWAAVGSQDGQRCKAGKWRSRSLSTLQQ